MFTMEINFPHEGFPSRAAVSAGNQRGNCRLPSRPLPVKMGVQKRPQAFLNPEI